MAIIKPTKPQEEFLPTGFGTAEGVVKNDFSDTKKLNGFSSDVEDILQGDNLNYTLDTIGKQLKYLTVVVDYITSITTNKIPYVDSNNQLNYGDINTFLPSQSGNSGKFLTTNGANQLSWAENVTDIGDPIFTLNFNKVLPENYVWLDGTGGDNGNGVVPTTGDWAALFAIYGYQYDTSYTGTANFRLPNFTNRTIWGGTTAGYIDAGLPDIKATFAIDNKTWLGEMAQVTTSSKNGATGSDGLQYKCEIKASSKNSIFGKSQTVQPASIKVRVYTRYK